jgi:nitric oxide reductase large subunit
MKWARSKGYVPRDWLVLLGLQVIIPAIGIIAACFLVALFRARQGDPTLLWVALALAVTGVVLLFVARLPLYRQGKFFTFGSQSLPETHRRLYWIAYVFIILSLLVMLAVAAALSRAYHATST